MEIKLNTKVCEISKILKQVKLDILNGVLSGICLDTKGNKVGNWRVNNDE